MKFTLALFAAGLVAAQDFSGVPQCALPCLQDAIPKVGCALTDTACQCAADKQEALVPAVAPCLLSACSSEDLGKAQAAAADACKRFLATASAGSGSARPSATGSVAAPPVAPPVSAPASASVSAPASASRAASAATSAPSAVASASRNATGASTTPSGTHAASATRTATGTGASAPASATGAASHGSAAVGGVAVAALFGIVAAL